MGDGTSDFDVQPRGRSRLAVVLPEGSNRQDCRFVQALSLDLDGVSQALRIEICYAARCHGAQFSIFVNFRQLSLEFFGGWQVATRWERWIAGNSS